MNIKTETNTTKCMRYMTQASIRYVREKRAYRSGVKVDTIEKGKVDAEGVDEDEEEVDDVAQPPRKAVVEIEAAEETPLLFIQFLPSIYTHTHTQFHIIHTYGTLFNR